MKIILSQSLVRKLSFAFDNLFSSDHFTTRETPEDNRTFDHKCAINARARKGFSFALIDIIHSIYENHGVVENDSAPSLDLFQQYRIAADELTASRKREMKRKHAAKLERQREREVEQMEVAMLIAA